MIEGEGGVAVELRLGHVDRFDEGKAALTLAPPSVDPELSQRAIGLGVLLGAAMLEVAWLALLVYVALQIIGARS